MIDNNIITSIDPFEINRSKESPVVIKNSITSQDAFEIKRSKLSKPAFDENLFSMDLFNFELMKKRNEYYMSYFSCFEIRSHQRQKIINYIIKEENFMISPKETKKDYAETVQNAVSSSSDFMPPKNFKIINSRQDIFSQSINEKSVREENYFALYYFMKSQK